MTEYNLKNIVSQLRQDEINFENIVEKQENIPQFFLDVWCDIQESKDDDHLHVWEEHLKKRITDTKEIASYFHSIEKDLFHEFNMKNYTNSRVEYITNPNILLNIHLLYKIKTEEGKPISDMMKLAKSNFRINYEDLKLICKLQDETEKKGEISDNYSADYLLCMGTFMQNSNITNENILHFFKILNNNDYSDIEEDEKEYIFGQFANNFSKNPNITLYTVEKIMKNKIIKNHCFSHKYNEDDDEYEDPRRLRKEKVYDVNKYSQAHFNFLSNRAFDIEQLKVLYETYYKKHDAIEPSITDLKEKQINEILKNPNISSRIHLEHIFEFFDVNDDNPLKKRIFETHFFPNSIDMELWEEGNINDFLIIKEFDDFIKEKLEEYSEQDDVKTFLEIICFRKDISLQYIRQLLESTEHDIDGLIDEDEEWIKILAKKVTDIDHFIDFFRNADIFNDDIAKNLLYNPNITNEQILKLKEDETRELDMFEIVVKKPSIFPDILFNKTGNINFSVFPNLEFIFQNPNIYNIKSLYKIIQGVDTILDNMVEQADDIHVLKQRINRSMIGYLMENNFLRDPKHWKILKTNLATYNLGNYLLVKAFEDKQKNSYLVEYKMISEIKKFLL